MDNEYSSLVAEDSKDQLKSSLYATGNNNPDVEAKLQALSKKTGIPVDAVRQNQPSVELNDRLENFDYEKVIKQSPKLSSWMADPDNAAVAHDDADHLSGMEAFLQNPIKTIYQKEFDYVRSLGKGVLSQGAGSTLAGFGELGDIFSRNASKIGDAVNSTFEDAGKMLSLSHTPKNRGTLDFSKTYLNNTNTLMPTTVAPRTDGLANTMSDSAMLKSAGASLKAAGDVIGVPKERQGFDTDVSEGVGQLGFQIATSLLTGNIFNGAMMSAQGADQMAEQVKNDKGSQAQVDEAVLLGAVITPLTESYGLDALLNRVPPALKNRTMRFIADKFAAGGIEAAQEATEGLLQNIAQRATTDPNADLVKGLGEQASVAAVSAALVRSALGVKGHSVAKEHEAFFQALQEGATESKLYQRLPDRFQELIKHYTENGPVQNVFINANKVNEYYQSMNIDPATAMSDAGATNFHEALDTGGDVVIPMHGFVAKIAPTDALQSLMPDLRLAQGDASIAEMKLEEANADSNQESIQKNIEAITAASESESNISTAVQDIINDVSGQLQSRYDPNTATKLATVMRGIAVLANRANPDANPVSAARELWAKYGLKVNASPLPEVLTNKPDFDVQIDSLIDRVRTGDVPNQAQVNGQSLGEFLREKGGIQDEGGELSARDVKSTNKAFTKNLFNPQGLTLDTARELAAEAGYVNADGTVADFLNSIDYEIRGEPVYSQKNFNNEAYQQQQALNDLGDWLDKMGINLKKSDNKTVKDFMKSAMGGNGQQFEQVTETEAFKKWFVDSKIKSKGKPKVMYHGTAADISEFKPKQAGAIFVTDNPDFAHGFATMSEAWMKEHGLEGAQNIIPVYVKAEKPFDYQNEKDVEAVSKKAIEIANAEQPNGYGYYGKHIKSKLKNGEWQSIEHEITQRAIKALGYDSFYVDEAGVRNLAVYEPSQLKSAVGNTGAFDANNPNILYQVPIDVAKAIDMPVTLPASSEFKESVANTDGAKITDDGLVIDLVRYQKDEQSESTSIRTGVFYLPKGSAQEKYYKSGKMGYGGIVKIQGETLIKNPIFVKGATGGKAPQAAYDMIKGKGAYEKMRSDVLSEVVGYGKRKSAEDVYNILDKYESDPDLAWEIFDNSKEGNTLPYAIQENIVAHAVREAGHDAVVGYSKGKSGLFISEVFDVRERSYPGENGEYDLHPQFDKFSYRQKSNEDKRGSIEIGNDRKIIINLFEKQNLSTFLHEAGHFYLEVLGDLASDESASAQIKADYASVLKFLNVSDRSQIGTDQHELFARANEAYLMEGKAPSNELRGVFQRFKAWMQFIYKTAKSLNVTINDDIRGVFDRIYATDAEIEDAKRQDGFQELFIDAKAAGMTDAEFNAYKDIAVNQTENAKDKLRNETMRIERLKREQWFKDERAQVADEVAAQYDAEPAAQAFETLTSKDGGIKLNRADIESRYGDNITKRLRRGYGDGKGAVYADDGIDADTAAEMLGYASGDELINSLANLPERKRFIAAESMQRMTARHGDLINDIAIADAAQDALHNGQREQVLKTELRALRKLIEPARKLIKDAMNADTQNARNATVQPSPSAFRDAARGIIGQKAVQDLNPNSYLLTERKASKQAFEAMAKKDYLVASSMKQRELLNHYLFIEATKAKAEAAKIYEYARSFEKETKRQKLGKAGADYLDQIDALLERYEFKQVSNKAIAKRKNLAAWVAEQAAEGNAVSIDESLLDDSLEINYRELPMDELRTVYDALKNIDHLATLKTKLIRKGQQVEFADVISELLNAEGLVGMKSTDELGKLNDKGDGIKAKGAALWRGFDAAHLKIEQIVEWLDDGKIDGPWARMFFDLADDAQTREYDLHRDITKRVQEISESMSKDWQSSMLDKTGITLPSTGNLTRYDLISIALNTGNEQNLQRLLDGRQWSKEQLDGALAKLNAEDWRFVQGMWDTLETLWPEIAALEKRQSGLEPVKVEHREFEPIEGLVLKGGYFPLVYDPKLSAVGEKQADATASVMDFMSRGFGRPSTDRGATKKRVDKFVAPVFLDYEQVLTSHMAKIIKDISHREAVLGLNKILTNGEIKSALIDKLGDSRYRQMRNWLEVLVNDRSDTLHQASGLGKIMRHARTNTAIVTMGFKISTSLSQFAGFAASADLVKPHVLTKALIQFTSHPVKTLKFVMENSGEMRNRTNTIDRDIKESLLALRGNTGKIATIQRTAFYLTAMADRLVSIPTWLGGYNQGLNDGLSEEDAIRLGDRAVRLSQGAGGAKDLAAVQRNNELMRLLTMYYTPFSVLYSRMRDVGHNVNGVKDLPRAVARTIALVMVPAVMGEILAGRPPDDDEDGIWWAIRKMLLYPLNSIPVLRDFSGYLEAGLIKASGEGQLKYPPSYKLSPIVGGIEKIAKVPGKIADVMDGSKEVNDVAWDLFETSGYVFGLPTAQPRITGEFMLDALSGEESPQDASEWLGGALFRRSK